MRNAHNTRPLWKRRASVCFFDLSLVIIGKRWELAFCSHPHLPHEECLVGGDPMPNSTKRVGAEAV